MHFGNPSQGHYPRKTKKTKKTETTKEKILRVLKETAGSISGAVDPKGKGKRRREQFALYMNMVDKLQSAKVKLPGRIELGPLTARAGKAGSPKVTKMSTIMDNYHNKALRMAQAKYYQKQVG